MIFDAESIGELAKEIDTLGGAEAELVEEFEF